MTNHILTNIEEINKKIVGLSLTRTTEDGWTKYFKDDNNEEWCEFYIETEYHGGGQPVLMKLPEPSQNELINRAIASSDPTEIAICAALLNYNERDRDKPFRELLIEQLENFVSNSNIKWTTETAEKIKLIINDSNLYDETNLRPIEGKSIQEITNDYSFFKNISKRAKVILNTANTRLAQEPES
jgi:hypothetical protein